MTADTLAAVIAEAPRSEPRLPQANAMLRSARQLEPLLSDAIVSELPSAITHGDYTPANVLFHGDKVGGIFDFDWVSRQPRLLDLAEALIFFAGRRTTPIDPDSIWSLVQTWQPDKETASAFLRSYQSVWPLGESECSALPLLMRECWLGVRIRAMRKVPHADRLRILTEGAFVPLEWIEGQGQAIAALAERTRPSR